MYEHNAHPITPEEQMGMLHKINQTLEEKYITIIRGAFSNDKELQNAIEGAFRYLKDEGVLPPSAYAQLFNAASRLSSDELGDSARKWLLNEASGSASKLADILGLRYLPMINDD